jgi:hypothetical protein
VSRLAAQVKELEERRSDERVESLRLRQEANELEADVKLLQDQQAADKQMIRDLVESLQRSQCQDLGVASKSHGSGFTDEPAPECNGDDELGFEHNGILHRVSNRIPTTTAQILNMASARRTKCAPMVENYRPGVQKGLGKNEGEDNIYDL